MVQVTNEYLQEHHEAHGPPFDRIPERCSGRLVLECDCRARLILDGQVALRRSRRVPECALCRKRFTLTDRGLDVHGLPAGHLQPQRRKYP